MNKKLKAAGVVFRRYREAFGVFHFDVFAATDEWRLAVAKEMLDALEAGEPIADKRWTELWAEHVPELPIGVLT